MRLELKILATALISVALAFPLAPKLKDKTELVTKPPTSKKLSRPVETAPKKAKVTIAKKIVKPMPKFIEGNCDSFRPLLAKYNWNVNVAVEVMRAESTCYSWQNNTEDYHPTCMGSKGLFQIGCDSTDNYAGMLDAEANIAQAYALYASRGWQPWGSTTCRVKVQCY